MTTSVPLNFTGSTPRSITVVAGAALSLLPVLGIAALALVKTMPLGPALYPLPLITALPYMLLGFNLGALGVLFAVFVPTVLFWAWSIHLFRGEPAVPTRSTVLFWSLAALNVVYFIASWDSAVRWQGYPHLLAVVVLNVLATYILWRMLVKAEAMMSFKQNFLFHYGLFVWLSWLAFPILGEMP